MPLLVMQISTVSFHSPNRSMKYKINIYVHCTDLPFGRRPHCCFGVDGFNF
jgi:hypothetical protein